MRYPKTMESLALVAVCLVSASLVRVQPGRRLATNARVAHVLLLSIDGFHAVDLANYIRRRPGSALARLSGHGVTYAAIPWSTNRGLSLDFNSDWTRWHCRQPPTRRA